MSANGHSLHAAEHCKICERCQVFTERIIMLFPFVYIVCFVCIVCTVSTVHNYINIFQLYVCFFPISLLKFYGATFLLIPMVQLQTVTNCALTFFVMYSDLNKKVY